MSARAPRAIYMCVDQSEVDPDVWRIVVSCPDEATEIIVSESSRKALELFVELDGIRDPEVGKMLVAQHAKQCVSCARWAADA